MIFLCINDHSRFDLLLREEATLKFRLVCNLVFNARWNNLMTHQKGSIRTTKKKLFNNDNSFIKECYSFSTCAQPVHFPVSMDLGQRLYCFKPFPQIINQHKQSNEITENLSNVKQWLYLQHVTNVLPEHVYVSKP